MKAAAGLVLLAAGGALCACVAATPSVVPASAPVAAAVRTAPGTSPKPAGRTAALNPALVGFYARQEERLLSQGLLRQDGGGPDTPFGADALASAFVAIALYDEYARGPGGRLVQQARQSSLRRWEKPVRIGLTFGGGMSDEARQRDRNAIAAYATRLSEVTGHPIELTDAEMANFHVLVLGEEERRAAGPLIRSLVPRVSAGSVAAATDLPTDIYCLALAFSEPESFTYTSALAVVRAEHPDLTRLSCYHEEIAQGLGLANDSPTARPSIFNDDEEFALLTSHDELLLRMLYDPRMQPGMTPAQAAPIARMIAAELVGTAADT